MAYNLGVAGLKQLAVVLCLIFCSLYYLKVNVANQLALVTDKPTDFSCYYLAARSVRAAHSPYVGTQYTYPPALAFLLTPVAGTSYLTARRVWFWCSQAFLLLAAFLTWRGLGRNRTAACSVAFVWALGGAAEVNFALGQMGPLLVLLLALAYWGSATRQGASVSAGFCLKLLPGILAVVPVLRRDGRAIAAMIAVTIVLLVLPAVVVSRWGAGPPPTDFWKGTPALLNWSVPAVALRIADPPISPPKLPPNWQFGNVPEGTHVPHAQQWMSVGIAVAVLLAGLAALAVSCRGRLNEAQVPWASAALITLAVAASPIAWSHYQILQYPGVALLLCHALHRRNWLLAASAVVLGAFLYPVPWGVMLDYYIRFSGWTAASPATIYIWSSVTPVAALLLFGVLLCQLAAGNSPRPQPQ